MVEELSSSQTELEEEKVTPEPENKNKLFIYDPTKQSYEWVINENDIVVCKLCEKTFNNQKKDKKLLPKLLFSHNIYHNALLFNDKVFSGKLEDFFNSDIWIKIQSEYSWIMFDDLKFRCKVCEAAFQTQNKSIKSSFWTCPEKKIKVNEENFTKYCNQTLFLNHVDSDCHKTADFILKTFYKDELNGEFTNQMKASQSILDSSPIHKVSRKSVRINDDIEKDNQESNLNRSSSVLLPRKSKQLFLDNLKSTIENYESTKKAKSVNKIKQEDSTLNSSNNEKNVIHYDDLNSSVNKDNNDKPNRIKKVIIRSNSCRSKRSSLNFVSQMKRSKSLKSSIKPSNISVLPKKPEYVSRRKKSMGPRMRIINTEIKPKEVSDEFWKCLTESYQWLYCVDNVLHCYICEEGYKKHPALLKKTIWTSPDGDNSQIQNDKNLFRKVRFKRHENTANHINATMNYLKPAIIETVNNESLVSSPPNNSVVSNIKPDFISDKQFDVLLSCYSWLSTTKSHYGCLICLEAYKKHPESQIESRFTKGMLEYEEDEQFRKFGKKVATHSESNRHKIAESLIKSVSVELESNIGSENKPLVPASSATNQDKEKPKSIKRKSANKNEISTNIEVLCPQCKSNFKNFEALQEHIGLCDNVTKSTISCPCNPNQYQFNLISKLDLHAAQEHNDSKLFKCTVCNETYPRISSLYLHILNQHEIKWNPLVEFSTRKLVEEFPCAICKQKFPTNILLTKHYNESNCRSKLDVSVEVEDFYLTDQSVSSSPTKRKRVKKVDPDMVMIDSLKLLDTPITINDEKSTNKRIRKSPKKFLDDLDNINGEIKKSRLSADKQTPKRMGRPPKIKKLTLDDNEAPMKVVEKLETKSVELESVEGEDIDLRFKPINIALKQKRKIIPKQKIGRPLKNIAKKGRVILNSLSKKFKKKEWLNKLVNRKKKITKNELETIEKVIEKVIEKPIIDNVKPITSPVKIKAVSIPEKSPVKEKIPTIVDEVSNKIQPENTGKVSKKISVVFHSQISPSKLSTVDVNIPNGTTTKISFMDRMKQIRELKKNRAEKERVKLLTLTTQSIEERMSRSLGENIDRIVDESLRRNAKPLKPIVRHKTQLTISCKICKLKFRSLHARDVHSTTVHKGEKLFACKLCSCTFSTHVVLRKHAQMSHSDKSMFAVFGSDNYMLVASRNVDVPSNNLKTFKCEYCQLMFVNKAGLSVHKSVHQTDKLVDSSNPNVSIKENIAKAKSFSPKLKKTSTIDQLVKRLIGLDTKSNPQSCLVCQEILDNDFEMHIHTLDHEKEAGNTEVNSNQFACPNCCRLFFGGNGKFYLKDHYNMSHLKKSAPSCDECKMQFTSTVLLMSHRRCFKNCGKRTHLEMQQQDTYSPLNNDDKLAFVCNRCQALYAGENAQLRFMKHYENCMNADLDQLDEAETETLDVEESVEINGNGVVN